MLFTPINGEQGRLVDRSDGILNRLVHTGLENLLGVQIVAVEPRTHLLGGRCNPAIEHGGARCLRYIEIAVMHGVPRHIRIFGYGGQDGSALYCSLPCRSVPG